MSAATLWLAGALLPAPPAIAHESEQYSLPIGRDFADLGPYFSKIFHGAIVDAVARTNDEITAAIENGRTQEQIGELQSGAYIAAKVWEFVFLAIPANELLDLVLASEPVKSRYPGMITMYRPPVSIYDDPLLVIDLTKAVRTFFRAGSVSAGGEVIGTDKLIHFINIGRIYHAKYASRIEHGLSEEDALRSAIESTSRNLLTSEDGVLGMWSTGIYSNGDLAADYAGVLFYRNLSEPVRIGPRTLPPMLERDGPFWRVAVKADSDFLTAFITPHWNEVLNPNRFAGYTMGRLRTLVAERCPDAVDWYRDPHGRQRTQADFEAIARELSTHFGVDYGHKANRGSKVTIASVCFQDAAATTPASTQDGRRAEATGSRAGAAGAGGADTPEVDAFDRTSLWWAARAGDAERVRQLATAGGDLDAADVDGETPLHAAARAGSVASARELISRGADPNRAALYGVTPLMLAAASGKTDVGLALLQAGADANARDLFGRTALHASAQRGDFALTRALLERGAQVQLVDDGGNTALQLAVRQGNGAMVALLENHRSSSPGLAAASGPRSDVPGAAGTEAARPMSAVGSGDAGAGMSEAPPAAGGGSDERR